MSPTPCPDCGNPHDPVSGYCETCEGPLELWRVQAYTNDWLAHTEEKPPPAPVRVVSRRRLGQAVDELAELGPNMIVAQLTG